ncbi:MAG: LysM peptidoglycan-binding domain-containing protein [Chloroflexota bacterium]|nr:LysM peptidoglycan-binding domain-containing protein [Chloroflexota bacterium]
MQIQQQQVWKTIQQNIFGHFVGKVMLVVGLVLLALGITLVTNEGTASAHSLCASGDTAYQVVGGDTLSGIGFRYHADWHRLAAYNHIANPNLIYINQTVCIQGSNGARSGTSYVAKDKDGDYDSDTYDTPINNSSTVSHAPAPVTSSSSSTYHAPVTTGTSSTSVYYAPVSTSYTPASPVGHYNPFPYPACTWWADERYHQLHGVFVPWTTNAQAWQWTARAYQYGWHVSSRASVGSIIDLQPWVQGAYGGGHVAVVEQVLSNGHVIASNTSWGANPYQIRYVEFAPGPGVTFIRQ